MAKTKEDPTGQAKNRRDATKALTRRLANAQKKVREIFKQIPYTTRRVGIIVNESQVVYDYELSVADQDKINAEIRDVINQELLDNTRGEMVGDWFWQDEIKKPYQQGTAEQGVQLWPLMLLAISLGQFTGKPPPRKMDLNTMIRSAAYQYRLQAKFVESFNSIKGLADNTSAQVITKLLAGVKAGDRPANVLASVDERFDVSVSSAARIANTSINEAYTDAKIATLKQVSDENDLNTAVMHVSALLPTTRANHAERHGNVYTPEDQQRWWNTGSNRINCHCSIHAVLLDSNNNVIDTEQQRLIQADANYFNGDDE